MGVVVAKPLAAAADPCTASATAEVTGLRSRREAARVRSVHQRQDGLICCGRQAEGSMNAVSAHAKLPGARPSGDRLTPLIRRAPRPCRRAEYLRHPLRRQPIRNHLVGQHVERHRSGSDSRNEGQLSHGCVVRAECDDRGARTIPGQGTRRAAGAGRAQDGGGAKVAGCLPGGMRDRVDRRGGVFARCIVPPEESSCSPVIGVGVGFRGNAGDCFRQRGWGRGRWRSRPRASVLGPVEDGVGDIGGLGPGGAGRRHHRLEHLGGRDGRYPGRCSGG